MTGDPAWPKERGEHLWQREPTAAEVSAGLATHEAVCAERWRQIIERMGRMETIVLSAAGALLMGMAGIIATMILKVHP